MSPNDRELVDRFRPLFEPRVMAVIGASASSFTPANDFIRQCLGLGYRGRLVPIHPTAPIVEGLPAARSLADVAEPVDYAYIAVAAARVPLLISEAAGRVKFAQVISSGFGEVDEGRELEAQLTAAGRESGIRLLGPNCLGLYSPAAAWPSSAAARRRRARSVSCRRAAGSQST